MTVIVAIKAQDGVVMVSDGAATYAAASGMQTIKQPTSKLVNINNALILGCSSSIGLAQCFTEELTKETNSCVSRQPRYAFENRASFRDAFKKNLWPHVQDAMGRAQAIIPVFGHQVAQGDCGQHSLACFLTKDGDLQLAQISVSGQIEFASDDLPFVSVGSGQPAADPFLAFLRKMLWNDKEVPYLRDALFAALWTVKHVVDVQPSGVAPPYQIMTMKADVGENGKKKLEIEEREDNKIGEHLQVIETLQDKIREASVGAFNPSEQVDQIPEEPIEQIPIVQPAGVPEIVISTP